jgi:RNA recognition motif-containing protein
MSFRIYVGNLPYSMTQAELGDLFAPFGKIDSATVVTDKYSGRSRGFGFVEMTGRDEGQKAIAALDGKDIQGRKLKVSEAQARKDKEGRDRDRSTSFKR